MRYIRFLDNNWQGLNRSVYYYYRYDVDKRQYASKIDPEVFPKIQQVIPLIPESQSRYQMLLLQQDVYRAGAGTES